MVFFYNLLVFIFNLNYKPTMKKKNYLYFVWVRFKEYARKEYIIRSIDYFLHFQYCL